LYNEQRLILEVEATLGCGKDHAKWQPVQAPGYRFIPTIEIDKKRIDEAKEFINELPEGLVKLKGDKLEINDIKNMSVLESYIDKANADFITIKRDSSKIIFSFETDGSLSAEDALKKSASTGKKPIAIYTAPNTSIKCGGAPQKILYLSADYLKKDNLSANFVYATPKAKLFQFPEIAGSGG